MHRRQYIARTTGLKPRHAARRILPAFLLLLCLPPVRPSAEERFEGRLSVETEHFTIVYEERDREAAEELLEYAEDVYERVTAYFGTRPPHAVVILDGRTDHANGSFTAPPNRIIINVASPSTGFDGNRTENWIEFVFTHEFTHFVHLTDARGPIGLASAIFGEMLSYGSGFFMPGWMVEGIATDRETAYTAGGRGRSELFELSYKAPLLEGKLFSLDQAAYSSDYPPQGRIYAAGYMLVNYLNATYGDDAFSRIHREFTAFPFLGPGPAIGKVTGKSMRDVFDDMKSYYLGKFEEAAAVPGGKIVSPEAWGNYYAPVASEAGIYAYRGTFDKPPEIVRFDPETGAEETVTAARLFDHTSFSVTARGEFVAFASAVTEYSHPAGEETISDLYLKDRSSEDVRRLTRGAHLFHPALSPDGRRLVAVRREGSYKRLVDVNLETGEISPLFGPDGIQVMNPVFSPDGRRIAFVANERGMQDIMILEFGPSGETNVFPLFTRDYAGDFNPRWKDENTVWFASDREGNLYLYEAEVRVDGDAAGSRLTRILRDPVGVLAGIPYGNGILYAGYSSRGYVLKTADPGMIERVQVAFGSDPVPPVPGRVSAAGEKPYADIPKIYLHFPFVALSRRIDAGGLQGYDLGANYTVSGGSYLGRYGFSSSVSYFPGIGQVGASSDLNVSLMPFSLGWSFSQSYGADYLINHFYADTHNRASVRFVLADSADFERYRYLSLETIADHVYEQQARSPFTFTDQFGGKSLTGIHFLSIGAGLSFSLSSLNAVPGIDVFRPGVSGSIAATVPIWYSPGPVSGFRTEAVFEAVTTGVPARGFLKLGLKSLYQPPNFPYAGQLSARGFTSDVMIGDSVTVASLVALDWIYRLPPLDLPLPFGFSLTGMHAGLHAEWGNGIGPSGFTAGRYLYAGLDVNFEVNLNSVSSQYFGAGVAARIDLRNPGAFLSRPEFGPYFYLGINGFRAAGIGARELEPVPGNPR